MMGSEWLYGAIALLVGLHVLTMLYAYRRQGEPAAPTQADGDVQPPVGTDEEGGTIACAHCGADNERGYQFCRECVADLSSSAPVRQSPDHSQPY